MKTILTLIAATFLILTMDSCKQCQECVKYPKQDDKFDFCRKDYASEDSYDQAYRYYYSQGYRCQ